MSKLNDQVEARIDGIQAFSNIDLSAFPVNQETALKFCRAAYGKGYQDALHDDPVPATLEEALAFGFETRARLPIPK